MAEATAPVKDKLERKVVGIRVAYVIVAVACYFGTLWAIAKWGTIIPTAEMVEVLKSSDPISVLDQDMVWSALQWLIGVIGLAVAGDTARPSGEKTASFGLSVTGNGSSTEKK